MLRMRVYGLTSLLIAAGCLGSDHTGPSDGTSTGDISSHLSLYAASPTTIIGLPGAIVPDPPAVQVSYVPSGKPAAGVNVSFTFSDGRGADYTAITNSKGVAVLDNLRFDSRAGQYNITASLPGTASVAFTAMSRGGVVVATYDLRKVSGSQVLFDPGNSLQLFEDGTYARGSGDLTGRAGSASVGYYKRPSQGVIEFYLNPLAASSFYASRNYLFAVGSLTGDVMKVTYQDYVDFDDEEYVLSK